MTRPRRPRVLLADDSAELLTTFEQLVASSCEVVGRVNDASDLIDEARKLAPDVIVVDLYMPGMDGLEACRQLKKAVPRAKTIIVSAINDPDITREALRAGASAFVGKMQAANHLVPAIQRVIALSA